MLVSRRAESYNKWSTGERCGNLTRVRMVEWGLRRLGVRKAALSYQPKGQAEKQVLAWWLHGQTTVGRRWIAKRLEMGYESRVSEAVSLVEGSRARNMWKALGPHLNR